MIKELKKDNLKVRVLEDRQFLGKIAANEVYHKVKDLLKSEAYINIIFAAAPSQNEFFDSLVTSDIDWSRINAFHMDEYVGLAEDSPQSFANFLKNRLFSKVSFKTVNYINGNAEDVLKECERYSNLLKEFPPHIVCMGIGENAHIAFNDPHVADFDDSKLVKVVDLDYQCRQQQVNDGCFVDIAEVPLYALTLTVPMLFSGTYIYCMVPGKNKAQALYYTLTSEITKDHPSTILRKHLNAVLFADERSSSMIFDTRAS